MKSLLMLLGQLGFDEVQSQLYLEVVNTGPITVLELSRNTNVKRTTVHFHIEQLIAKGLVTEGVRRGRRVLTAVSLEKLAQIVEEQKSQVVAMERSLERVIKEASESGNNDQSYGVGFVVEDGIPAIERLYKEAMLVGDVISYVDLVRLDGLHEVRTGLFQNVALRQSMYSFKELYYSRDPGVPEYSKKLKAYKPFHFVRSNVKLSGNVVNVIVFEKTVALIIRDTEWKVVKLTQGLVAQLLVGMMESVFLCK